MSATLTQIAFSDPSRIQWSWFLGEKWLHGGPWFVHLWIWNFCFSHMQQPLMSVTFGSNTAFRTGSPYHELIFTFHWYMGGGYISTKTPFISIYIYIHLKVCVYFNFRYICNQNHLKSRYLKSKKSNRYFRMSSRKNMATVRSCSCLELFTRKSTNDHSSALDLFPKSHSDPACWQP